MPVPRGDIRTLVHRTSYLARDSVRPIHDDLKGPDLLLREPPGKRGDDRAISEIKVSHRLIYLAGVVRDNQYL